MREDLKISYFHTFDKLFQSFVLDIHFVS